MSGAQDLRPADAIWRLLRAATGVYGGCLSIIIGLGTYDASNDELNRSLCVAFAAIFSVIGLVLLRAGFEPSRPATAPRAGQDTMESNSRKYLAVPRT